MTRDESIDTAKGIGMLAVIAAHVGFGMTIRTFFYIFHLTIFFIISGYFFHIDDWNTFFKKKIKGYLKTARTARVRHFVEIVN